APALLGVVVLRHELCIAGDDGHRRLEIVKHARERLPERSEARLIELLLPVANELEDFGGLARDERQELELAALEAAAALLVEQLDRAQRHLLAKERDAQDVAREVPDGLGEWGMEASVRGRIMDDERLLLGGHPASHALRSGDVHPPDGLVFAATRPEEEHV